MAKPKILILTSSYHPNIGGVERHVREVAKRLKSDYSIIIATRYQANIPAYQKVDGIPVHRLPKNLNRLNLSLWTLNRYRSLKDVSVIHSHDLFIHFFRRLFPRAFWVHTFHGYEGYPLSTAAIEARRLIKSMVNYTFGIGKFIEKWYGTVCDEYLYGAADLKNIQVSKNKDWDGLFYGRLEKDTGFWTYFEAMKILYKKDRKLRFAVAGDGSLKKSAESMTQKKGLAIKFLGQIPEVTGELCKAKVAFTSGYLGIIEAAALQVPIIAFYNNPLKRDYLKLHPKAMAMKIVDSQENIVKAFEQKPDPKILKDFADWAKAQSWEKVANHYRHAYNKA